MKERLEFDRISELLTMQAQNYGVAAFSIQNELVTPDLLLHDAGMLSNLLIIHGESIAKILKLSSESCLPFVSTTANTETGIQIQPRENALPISVSTLIFDAALEHSISLGIQSLGYSKQEWDALDFTSKIVPLEPYMDDLEHNWLAPEILDGTAHNSYFNFPVLKTLNHISVSDLELSEEQEFKFTDLGM